MARIDDELTKPSLIDSEKSFAKGGHRPPFFCFGSRFLLGGCLAVSLVVHLGLFLLNASEVFAWGQPQTADAEPLHLNLIQPFELRLRGISVDAGGVAPVAERQMPKDQGAGETGQEGRDERFLPGKQSIGVNNAEGLNDSQSESIYYHTLDELTVKPVVISDAELPPPKYIPDINPAPVVVVLRIGIDGDVDDVELSENFLSDEARNYLLDSVRRLKFSPGQISTRVVRSQISMLIRLDSALPVQ